MAVIDGKIKCYECGENKEISFFLPHTVKRGSGACKKCRNVYKKNIYYRDPEKSRKTQREYVRKKGKAWKRAISQRVYKKHGKKYALKQYGITLDEYYKLLQEQNQKCALCGTKENSDGKKLYVDHCHTSKKIRGILCRKCNTGIGLLGDTLDSIRKAYEYILKSESKLEELKNG